MDAKLRSFSRAFFQLKIFKSDGAQFEKLFTEIMTYRYEGFRKIKPWGNIGDRKNDGYIPNQKSYYQVYAPEDVRNTYPDAVKKLKEDLEGLLDHWNEVENFYFVVNDKFYGVNADCERTLRELQKKYALKNCAFLTSDDLERILFELEDDQIFTVAPMLEPDQISLDFSALNTVISHIMELSNPLIGEESLIYPDWDKKIRFNDLSEISESYLKSGFLLVNDLDEYLQNEGNFFANDLKNKIQSLYTSKKQNHCGDELFSVLVQELCPSAALKYQSAVYVIMAKYFECCDIFEEPK